MEKWIEKSELQTHRIKFIRKTNYYIYIDIVKLKNMGASKGQDRIGQDRTGQGRTGQDRTGQDRTGQDRTGQDRTGQVRSGQNNREFNETR